MGVQVSAPTEGADKEKAMQHVAHRRYTQFAELYEHMRQQQESFDKLPPMPPRSKKMPKLVHQHMQHLAKIAFLHQRRDALEALIKAMVKSDPELKDDNLRKFLGIVEPEQESSWTSWLADLSDL